MENKEIKNNTAELNDEVLENVSGGNDDYLEFYCPDCNVYFSMTMSGCPRCGRGTQITGYRFGRPPVHN